MEEDLRLALVVSYLGRGFHGWQRQRRGRTVYKEVVYYLIETLEEEVTLSDEHIAYQWLPHDKALQAITFANSRRVVGRADEHLKAIRNLKST